MSTPIVLHDIDFRTRLAAIQARITAACQRVGRDPAEVRLLPVSKTVAVETLRLAHAAGCCAFGENRVQEAQGKYVAFAAFAESASLIASHPGAVPHTAALSSSPRWVLIGHLQTNKAKVAARFIAEFQALDSLHLAEALVRALETEGRVLDVLVEVNTSGEASKFGVLPAELSSFLRQLAAFPSLRPRGLMTLALPLSTVIGEHAVRACFTRLRMLRDRARDDCSLALPELSMGMSGDFEWAIEEGATTVRIGQALFGSRVPAG